MRSAFVIVLLCGTASAQPGMTAVAPLPPQQPVQLMLTADEAELLQTGEISDAQHIGGGVVSLFVGWGVGQAVQGRWSETGWMFTVGEGASVAALLIGLDEQLRACPLFSDTACHSNAGDNLMIAGLIGIAGFRVWEVVDAFAGPPAHNQRLRALRARLGLPPPPLSRVQPFVAPGGNGGGVAGVTLAF